jgi:hypothetical protein
MVAKSLSRVDSITCGFSGESKSIDLADQAWRSW